MPQVLPQHVERRAGRNRERAMGVTQPMRTGRKQPLRTFRVRHGEHIGAVGKEFHQLGIQRARRDP